MATNSTPDLSVKIPGETRAHLRILAARSRISDTFERLIMEHDGSPLVKERDSLVPVSFNLSAKAIEKLQAIIEASGGNKAGTVAMLIEKAWAEHRNSDSPDRRAMPPIQQHQL